MKPTRIELVFTAVINLHVISHLFQHPVRLNRKAFGRTVTSFFDANADLSYLQCALQHEGQVSLELLVSKPHNLSLWLSSTPSLFLMSDVWTVHSSLQALFLTSKLQRFSLLGDQSYFLPQRENKIYCSKILQAPHHPTCKSISTNTAGSPPSVAGQAYSTCSMPACLFRELDPLTQTFSLLHLYHFLPVANILNVALSMVPHCLEKDISNLHTWHTGLPRI